MMLTDGHIVVTGKWDGFDVTLEGDIEDVEVAPEKKRGRYDDYSGDFEYLYGQLYEPRQYVLKFKPKDGVQYTVKKHPKMVKRTAEIYVDNLQSIQQARRRVGAPPGTPYTTKKQGDGTHLATFRWDEAIYD